MIVVSFFKGEDIDHYIMTCVREVHWVTTYKTRTYERKVDWAITYKTMTYEKEVD